MTTPWILERARAAPDAIALAGDDGTCRWGELAAGAHARAAGLRRAGLAPGDLVATRLPPGRVLVELFHAVQIAGLTWLPIHARLTDEEVRWQLGHAEPAAFYAGADELPAPEPAATLAPEPVVPARDLLVLFTSGTTGRPKAARLSAGSLAASAAASARRLGERATDRWLACLPLHHVGGLSILVRSVRSGAAVELHRTFDAQRVADALASRCTLASLVPTMLRRALEAGARGGAELRAILLGGSAAPPGLVASAWAQRLPALPTYGLTEAASQVATAAPGAPPAAGSVGRPLPGTEVRIVDGAGRALPIGGEGEIQVRGPALFSGYLHDADATRGAFDGAWLRTGDVGCVAADGSLRALDRRRDLIVTGGENVAPAEVEARLLDHPDVAEAGVAAVPDADLGHAVAAFVVPRPGRSPTPAALQAFCRERLAGYKCPREVTLRAELPRNTLGKLLRDRLVPDAHRTG